MTPVGTAPSLALERSRKDGTQTSSMRASLSFMTITGVTTGYPAVRIAERSAHSSGCPR